MKLGSHNSFTYLPVKQWYLKPFAFMARCQEVDVWNQYFLGVRLFDLRVRFDSKGNPVICHSLAEYKADDSFIFDTLKKLNNCKGIHVRVVLELRKSNTEKYDRQKRLFEAFCINIKKAYRNITFFGGNDRTGFTTGEKIYDFNNDVQIVGLYSSTTSLFKINSKLLRIIDDWYPRYYALRYNKKNLENLKEYPGWVHIDFVNFK